MKGYKVKYFLKAEWQKEYQEVTQEEFVQAERSAGFRPKPGCGPCATAGFSSGSISGKVQYIPCDDGAENA